MKTLTTMKRTAIAGVAAASLGMTLAAPAQADMFAYAKLVLNDFRILGSDGDPLDTAVDFGQLNYTSTADMDGSLTGTPGFANAFSTSNADDIDFATDCLTTTGDCSPLTENAFPFMTGPQGLDYVAADQYQSGSPIDGLLPTTGATIGAIAVGSLSATSATGSANANNGLQASWTFSLTQDQGITFAGDISVYLEAFSSADEISPGSASAGTEFLVTITDALTGEVIFDSGDEPGGDIPSQTTASNAGFGIDLQTCGDVAITCGTELNIPISLTTVELTAGRIYQLSARNNVNIDINRAVPEPGILALMGAGFIGIFAAGRRRRRA